MNPFVIKALTIAGIALLVALFVLFAVALHEYWQAAIMAAFFAVGVFVVYQAMRR